MRPLYRGIASFGKNEATFIAKDSIMSDSFQPFRKAAGNHRLLCASQELQQIVALFSQDAPLILRGKLRKVEVDSCESGGVQLFNLFEAVDSDEIASLQVLHLRQSYIREYSSGASS